jgi:hypothetical protein
MAELLLVVSGVAVIAPSLSRDVGGFARHPDYPKAVQIIRTGRNELIYVAL